MMDWMRGGRRFDNEGTGTPGGFALGLYTPPHYDDVQFVYCICPFGGHLAGLRLPTLQRKKN
jgi:hypothetical protein